MSTQVEIDIIIISEEVDRGKLQCATDIELGTPKLYWQTRGAWGEYMTTLMAERFSVAVQHTSDMTTYAEISFHAGYNEAAADYIDGKYGTGSYQAALDEVDRFRMERYQMLLKSKSTDQA